MISRTMWDRETRIGPLQTALLVEGVSGKPKLQALLLKASEDKTRPTFNDYPELIPAAKVIGMWAGPIERAEEKSFEAIQALGVDERPSIVQTNRDLHEVTLETWAHVAENEKIHRELFSYQGRLARVIGRDITILDKQAMRFEVVKKIAFYERKANGVLLKSAPDMSLIENMLATPNPPLPSLARLAYGAAVDSSGRLVSDPGFDEASGIFLSEPIAVPRFEGTEKDAAAWLKQELLGDFEYAENSDLANAMGALITAFGRDFVGRSPIFGFEAPTPGIGKTLQAETILSAGLGVFTTMGLGQDDAETRKRMTASLLTGAQGILLDNPNSRLDSETLSSYVTTDIFSDRLLGSSTMAQIKTMAVVFIAANNPSMSLEIARRYVRIRLLSKTSRPWERIGFRHDDLRSWTREHRGEILGSIMRMIEGWIAAGRPAWSGRPLGSFEQWSRTVGGILENAGVHGFLENHRSVFDQSDSEGAAVAAFVQAWRDCFGSREVSVSDLWPLMDGNTAISFRGATDRAQRAVFGRWLAKLRDRIIDDSQIIQGPPGRNGASYRLKSLTETAEQTEHTELYSTREKTQDSLYISEEKCTDSSACSATCASCAWDAAGCTSQRPGPGCTDWKPLDSSGA